MTGSVNVLFDASPRYEVIPPIGDQATHGFQVAFYALIGLALVGAAIAAAFVESKPKAAPRAEPLEAAELALEKAA
jgi:hypothetical protein